MVANRASRADTAAMPEHAPKAATPIAFIKAMLLRQALFQLRDAAPSSDAKRPDLGRGQAAVLALPASPWSAAPARAAAESGASPLCLPSTLHLP